MECCAKLESFLEEQELASITQSARIKVIDKLIHFSQLITELRNENSELNAVLEREQFNFEKEIFASRKQLQECTDSLTKNKLQVSELEENLSTLQKQWRELQKNHDSSVLELQAVKRDNELLNQEKRNLSDQLEKRRTEIEKLNGDLKNLLDQVTSANEAKFEAIAASEEAKLKESNLQHQVNRLEQEKELLNRQITDLHAELTQKNTEIHTLKREKATNTLELKTLLEDKSDEVHIVHKRLDCYKEVVEEKDARIEALAEKIRQLNQSHSKEEEQFNLELNAQTKLIELHKNASEGNQKRVQELMRAFEEAQKLLKESNDSCDEMEKHCHDVETKCKVQLEEKKVEITRVSEELRRVKEAAKSMSQDSIEKIFPVAAATSRVLHSGMTLTEMYVEYIRLQEELQQQKNENVNLNRELKQIIAEIEEKTPIINQRMQEYDKLNETVSSLKSQLANAQVDLEKILEERNDSKRFCNLTTRENARLKSQVTDLNRQVQVLLKEVEEARGGTIKNYPYGATAGEEEVTSTDEITAAKVISRHLVTFRDIEEIQLKNQQLLVAIRDLGDQHEKMEKKISSEITSKCEAEIANLSSQLQDLQKKRSKQAEMLETIIRQRDMYRVLLTSQGFSESLLGQSDGSSSILQRSPTFSADPQLKEAKSAMHQLQAEFDNYKKGKAENERMLTEQVDKMRADLSDMRIQNAKLASQCEYSEERVKMLQSNLETYKKEYSSYKDKNKQHSTMIVQHQQTINKLRQDLMVSHEKIAKSDVTIENLKAERDLLKSVETRLLQEKESVVREQQHQSRMMANLQAVQNNLERIESETKRNLQYQVEKLEKENSIFKTKVENANEEYRSAVNVWEKQRKELQSKIDAEVERNRKLHEDLVDAYSQVHALKQELLNTKSQASVEKAQVNNPPQTPGKALPSTPKAATTSPQVGLEVKLLKEQLNEAQEKLKGVEDKLTITSKSAEQYLNMCKDLELRVKEQDEINKHLQESMNNTLLSSSDARNAVEKSLEEMEKNNRELIEENVKLTQSSSIQVTELQKKLAELSKTEENYKNQAEVSKKTANQAREDCQNQMKMMHDVQEKYERELMLHAEDIKTLSELKEQHNKCCVKIAEMTEIARAAEQTLTDSKESWCRQEEILRSETVALSSKIVDLETCNNNLHHQLELMGTQMAALQSKNWEDTPYSTIQSDLKDTQHLLQVIQFIKKEKEIISTQYDVTKSENVRLNLKVQQLTNEVNSLKAEVKELMNNVQAKASSEAQHAELLKKIEMMNLLSESNNLLRMEKDSLSEAKSKLEIQFQELMEKFEPLSEKEKELAQNIDMLSAENAALRMEVKSWQSRTNQLLEQSHRIGPQEYKNMLREKEELRTQKNRVTEELQRKQAEVSQVTARNASLIKEREATNNSMREKTEENMRLTENVNENQKTMLQIKKIGRKYKTQYDELKVEYDELVTKSQAADALNQEQAMQEMQKKIDSSEKIVKELKEEIDKQKESIDQGKKSVEVIQSQANAKEEKAKKLLAQFRVKYAQLNSQKDALTATVGRLTKDNEECKNRLATFSSQEKTAQQVKLQTNSKVAFLENELKKAADIKKERDLLQKQYDEFLQKVSQQKQGIKPPMVGLGERTSGSGAEPLTANIKPLTSPSTSGTRSGLSHSPHPHTTSNVNRPTPTASIRPMAIGTSSPAVPPQTRTATVLPTSAAPAHSEEDSVLIVAPTPSVPHATVQPTPATATATVAPTTMAITVSPVISEVSSTIVQEESAPISIPSVHVAGRPAALVSATASVPPRIDVSDVVPEVVAVDSPAPTASVIVSPPMPQTQVCPPTVKRQREESPGTSDSQEGSLKRIKMISEGSQTNRDPITSVVAPTNIAIVPLPQAIAVSEPGPSVVQPEPDTTPTLDGDATDSTAVTQTDDELISAQNESGEAEILDDDKEEPIIEWDSQEEKIFDEFEGEGMEEEAAIDEGEEEVEQMQGIDVRSPDDEDMAEEQQDEAEEMLDQPAPATPDTDILDSTSDIQMDADSSSLQNAPTEQVMAPPAFPPTLEIPSQLAPPQEVAISSTITAPRVSLATGPARLERQPPVSRQHLTPFTIPGQGSNFEEGDDGIVPSTPTLYVPRRTDGFAEAVSSPHVPQVRFLFSSSDSSPTQQGLSQLASQGALGMDDTRMDLSQFDEGGRTVPSTPIQVSPPEATVPDDVSVDLEPVSNAAHIELRVPVIKVDLVEETPAEATTEGEGSETIEATSASVKDQQAEEKALSETSESPLRAEETVAASASSEKSEDSVIQNPEPNKDTSIITPQRRPIVWRKRDDPSPSSGSEPSASKSETSPPTPSGLLSAPSRGRPRTRRTRFGSSAGNAAFARGRGGGDGWSQPQGIRRGRTTLRRRSMY